MNSMQTTDCSSETTFDITSHLINSDPSLLTQVLILGLSLATLLATVTSSYIDHLRLLPREATATFGYTALDGPLNWYGLDPKANEMCAKGKNQSPLNIEPGSSSITTLDPTSRPSLNYPPVYSANLKNLGSTVEVELHFHTPSEHRLRGEYYPMEMHLVHRRAEPIHDGTKPLLVLGVWFQLEAADRPLAFIGNVFSHINEIATPGDIKQTGALDFADLASHVARNDVYHYAGSLTTPPCSEGVTWLVSGQPLVLDVQIYNDAKRVMKFNSRGTQNDLGHENLLEHEAKLLRP